MKQFIYLNEVPKNSTWIFPNDKPKSQEGWYWKYNVINAYHGPYATKDLAVAAAK